MTHQNLTTKNQELANSFLEDNSTCNVDFLKDSSLFEAKAVSEASRRTRRSPASTHKHFGVKRLGLSILGEHKTQFLLIHEHTLTYKGLHVMI